MKKLILSLGACLMLVAALVTPAAATADDAPAPDQPQVDGRYVVVMEELPLVTQFGQDGLDTTAAKNKGQAMKAEHARVLSQAGVPSDRVDYEYTVALNGFAAELSDTQVSKIKSNSNVLMVLPDTLRQLQTDSSPDFIGVSGPTGAHRQKVTGEGVVVGVIDSGIWPEHPSFADDGSYDPPPIDLGPDSCDFGDTDANPNDAPFECNNKLIGARTYIDGYKAAFGLDEGGFDSARDDDGHGTHTASTAAGNADVDATILGTDIGAISGIAPRAHVVAYKACGALGCTSVDLAAAIDQATADGVDVINYSIGGGARGPGADGIAFLFAADAGVRVATSAGNSGPGAGTVGSPAVLPWLTSVGANTQSRFFEGSVTLGNGETYTGASLTQSAAEAPLVDAEFAGGDLCIPGSLDSSVVEGKIVLCRRGLIARVAKSEAVFEAGGVGMVLYNVDNVGDLSPDSHFVPSVHVDLDPGLAIKAYIAENAGATASISAPNIGTWPNAPTMTSFSSRGPNVITPDIIKPDITAPGFHIAAGYSPMPVSGPQGELFAALGGTSMSSPHVAGAFALLAQEHPDWSAGATKSAVMTTADPDVLDNDRVSPADAFAMGSGMLNPGSPKKAGSSFQPGLVYEAGYLDYLGFLCDTFPEVFSDPAGTCAFLADLGVPTRAVDLNYPSIAVSELAGSEVITRTVTSVAKEKGWRTYTVSVDAPEGYDVEVYPSSLRLKQGQSATYQVRITNANAPVGEWRHGSLTWSSKGYEVRSPIAVQGRYLRTAAEVTGSGEDGSLSFPITFGYSGVYSAAAHGLEPATVFSDTVDQDPDQNFDPEDGFSNVHEVTVSGAALLRIAMPPDATEAGADLDVYVYGPAGNLVGSSGAGGTDERVDLVLPADGTYRVYVHGWSTVGADSDYNLYTWAVSATPGGNMNVDSAPDSATLGATEDIQVSWTGATTGQWHLGAVSHTDDQGLIGLTIVDVDNR